MEAEAAVRVHAIGGITLWQDGFYDRILRRDEDSLDVAAYIVANPVRAGLVHRVTDYPYSGSSVCSLEDLGQIWIRRN